MAFSAKRAASREEVQELARELYRKRYPEGRPAETPPRNERAALLLTGGESLEFMYRGRLYEVGFPSFSDGVKLDAARRALERAEAAADPTPELISAYAEALRFTASLATRYLFPARPTPQLPRPVRAWMWARRLLWLLRLRRNPYRNATEAEVGQLLGFFLRSRMRSRAGSRSGSGHGRRLIYSTTP